MTLEIQHVGSPVFNALFIVSKWSTYGSILVLHLFSEYTFLFKWTDTAQKKRHSWINTHFKDDLTINVVILYKWKGKHNEG